jgi:hypothetical protein
VGIRSQLVQSGGARKRAARAEEAVAAAASASAAPGASTAAEAAVRSRRLEAKRQAVQSKLGGGWKLLTDPARILEAELLEE